MTRHKKTITLSIDEGDVEKLKQLAQQKDIYWGDEPSISQLIRHIANGSLHITSSNVTSEKIVNRLTTIDLQLEKLKQELGVVRHKPDMEKMLEEAIALLVQIPTQAERWDAKTKNDIHTGVQNAIKKLLEIKYAIAPVEIEY